MSKLYYKTLSGLIFVSVISWTLIFIYSAHASVTDGTIDPNNVGNENAWSDNAGWVNFGTGVGAGDIHITNAGISGYAWSQNFGWINMNPDGSGVLVDPVGNLSGSAWGENTGYIDFSSAFIDQGGLFGGTATGPVVGTINFNCVNCVVETDYRPQNFQGGRSRREDPIPEPLPVFSDEGSTVDVKSSADQELNPGDFNPQFAADQRTELIDLLDALILLFQWMDSDDSQLVKSLQPEVRIYKNLFLKRSFHRLIGIEYLQRYDLNVYEFQYRLALEQPIEIAVDLMKSTFLNFGGYCYDPNVLKFTELIDTPEHPFWFERYAYVMKPWMDALLHRSDYVLWEDISRLGILQAFKTFLVDHCSVSNPFLLTE